MESTFSFLCSVAMFIIAVVCTIGVLNTRFKDNIIQCCGMCIAATFAWIGVWSVDYAQEPRGLILVSFGIALFGLGTFVKYIFYNNIYFKRRFGGRADDFANSKLHPNPKV